MEHADAGEHVARRALEQQRALTGADPDLVVLRVVVELDQQAAVGEGDANSEDAFRSAERQPPRARHDAPASSVYQIPPLAAAA